MSIKLYSVSKTLGSRRFERTIARDVTWTIEPRSRYVILSNQPESLAVFMNLIAGLSVPTEGWIKHEGRISPPGGFLRYSIGRTPLEFIRFLAPLYQFDAEELLDFVTATVKYDRLLRTPLERLPAALRRELNFILTYAIPCDYYFYGTPRGCRPEFQKVGQQILARRSKEATMLLGAGSEPAARSLGGDTRAAILHRGNFTLYEQLEDALMVFAQLDPEPIVPGEAIGSGEPEEEIDLLLGESRTPAQQAIEKSAVRWRNQEFLARVRDRHASVECLLRIAFSICGSLNETRSNHLLRMICRIANTTIYLVNEGFEFTRNARVDGTHSGI